MISLIVSTKLKHVAQTVLNVAVYSSRGCCKLSSAHVLCCLLILFSFVVLVLNLYGIFMWISVIHQWWQACPKFLEEIKAAQSFYSIRSLVLLNITVISQPKICIEYIVKCVKSGSSSFLQDWVSWQIR